MPVPGSFTASVVLAIFAALLVIAAGPTSTASASHTGGMDAMSIDVDPFGAPANAAMSLGSRETEARINENDVLDADEDLVDALQIDVTATNVPASDAMIAFVYALNAGNPNVPGLCLTAYDAEFLLFDGFPLLDFSAPVPDCDGSWSAILARTGGVPGPPPGASGSGVLTRLTIESREDAFPGLHELTFELGAHVSEADEGHDADALNGATICINAPCDDPDTDGVLTSDDDCPTVAGPPENDGCPPPGPPAVGGITGLLDGSNEAPPSEGPPFSASYPWVALSAVIPVLTAGGWLTMRFVRAGRSIN